MFKTKIMDGIKKLVAGDRADKGDDPDQRLQRIHLLLDNAEKNIDEPLEKSVPKAGKPKKADFSQNAYYENMARVEKEILDINAAAKAKKRRRAQPGYPADVAALEREIDAVRRMLLEHSETTEFILRGIAAEKTPELEKISAHDAEINAIKSEILKAVRIMDAVSSDKKALEDRIKKVEDAESSAEDYDARIRRAAEEAILGTPLQKDRANMIKSISGIRKDFLVLKEDVESKIAKYPESITKLESEISRIKGVQKIIDARSAGKSPAEAVNIIRDLKSIDAMLIGYGRKIESIEDSIASQKLPEFEKLNIHEKELESLKSEILKLSAARERMASERKALNGRLGKIENAQKYVSDYDERIQDMIASAMNKARAQNSHAKTERAISGIHEDMQLLKNNKLQENERLNMHDSAVKSLRSELARSAKTADAAAAYGKTLEKRIKKIEDAESSAEDSDTKMRKAVEDAISGMPAQKDHSWIKSSISGLKKDLQALKEEIEKPLEEYPESLAKLKKEITRMKEAQKLRDMRASEEDKTSRETFAAAKDLAAVKKALEEQEKAIDSVLAEIADANKAIAQNRAKIKSILGEIDSEKADALERENNSELIEEELSGIEGEIGGIKGAIKSISAKRAKKRKAKKVRRRHIKAKREEDNVATQKIHPRSSLLQTLREYTNEERMRARYRKNRETEGSIGRASGAAGIKTTASKSDNPEYIELKRAIENKNYALKLHRQKRK